MRTAVINVVGLSESLLGPHMPRITAFADTHGRQSYPPEFPAVTCTSQSAITTGLPVAEHGVVGNGWYDREFAEVRFWKQSNWIVRGPKLWDILRRERADHRTAKLFWWYNMHSSADFTVTPRPLYPSDGSKVFDIHTQPMGMRDQLKRDLGDFPFPAFWGPASGIASSEWIAACARWTEEAHRPDLHLVYLPHLDYPLQKLGPDHPDLPGELEAIDRVGGELIDFYHGRGVRVLVLSEYGITPVSRPVHLNRLFRKQGWLSIKDELGHETLDYGGCRVFAVADHQVAHIYVQDRSLLDDVATLLKSEPGVEELRKPAEIWGDGIATARAGDFIAVASPEAWFTYYFWEDDALAPDYARTIDIHRKPGYDPCELFLDPELNFPKWRIAQFLMKKKLGLRARLDVIPLDASLVQGSHGRDRVPEGFRPVLFGTGFPVRTAMDVHHAILDAAR